MDKKDLLELLASNKKFFVLVFCVIFGVISGESYKILKFPAEPRFRKILPKFIVALFVCFISTPIIEYIGWDKKYYSYCMLIIAAMAMPIFEWGMNTLFPTILSILLQSTTGLITKLFGKHKKDDTK